MNFAPRQATSLRLATGDYALKLKKLKISLKRRKPPAITLLMTPAEEALYRRSIRGCGRVLEFGVGGSTMVAMQEGVQHLLSVETDPVWSALALKTPGIGKNLFPFLHRVNHSLHFSDTQWLLEFLILFGFNDSVGPGFGY